MRAYLTLEDYNTIGITFYGPNEAIGINFVLDVDALSYPDLRLQTDDNVLAGGPAVEEFGRLLLEVMPISSALRQLLCRKGIV